MRKIPTLYKRDPDDMKHVLPEVNPDCAWVLKGQGTATRKFDGTCVLVRDDAMFARREVKPGKQSPADFELVETDQTTGKSVGWVPVTEDPEYARHWEAYSNSTEGGSAHLPDGTYELCGPKVNGNPEGLEIHILVPHGDDKMLDVPLDYDGLKSYLLGQSHEGIVWWHEDGRRAKLKRRDFA